MSVQEYRDWLDMAFVTAKTVRRLVPIVQNVSTQLASQSRNRVAIRFEPASTSAIYIDTQPLAGVNQGLVVTTGNRGVPFNQRTDGDMATNEWHAFSATAAHAIWVIEVLATCPCPTGH